MTQSFGVLGHSLDSLSRSAFVQWFQLEATGEGATAADVVFRPSGPAFRALVALRGVTSSGLLRELELHVARAFLDDRRQGMFARDIVKSFAQAAAPMPDVAALASEIMFRDPPSPALMRGSGPPLPERPSPTFLTVVGAARRSLVVAGPVSLLFVNEASPTNRLVVRVWPE